MGQILFLMMRYIIECFYAGGNDPTDKENLLISRMAVVA
jgi:hypothetical protein